MKAQTVFTASVGVACFFLGLIVAGHGCHKQAVTPISTVTVHDTIITHPAAIHDTVTKHTTTVQATNSTDTVLNVVHDTTGTHVDTLFKADSTYSYGFALKYPDSAKINATVLINGFPKIPDKQIKLDVNYQPAPVKLVTNTVIKTETIKPSWWSSVGNDLEWLLGGMGLGGILAAILIH
jgi:hypothetical protein